MTAHNWRQRRDRLMREIREANTALLWYMPRGGAHGKRLRTISARRLLTAARLLHWHLQRQP